jgi:ribA/ribD-fused uncharacterized protein
MRFRGKYYFLSNFYPAEIIIGGQTYKTTEHYYQSQKTDNLNEQRFILESITPSQAKKRGSMVNIKKDWDQIKLAVMYIALKAKFIQHKDLMKMLLDTKGEYICEENDWGDRYWGMSNGVGENHLGVLLMKIRDNP